MRWKTLHVGKLFHGTDCVGDLATIEGPAWFCEEEEPAKWWAGWAAPPNGRVRGPKRVAAYALRADVLLVDTVSLADWQRLGVTLLGEPDPIMIQIARAVKRQKWGGWYGRTEVMLAKSEDVLRKLWEKQLP
jgi:hypothetical protein